MTVLHSRVFGKYELRLDMVTDWNFYSYVCRFDYIALRDDDACRSAILSVRVPRNVSDHGAVRSVKTGDGIRKQKLLLMITRDS